MMRGSIGPPIYRPPILPLSPVICLLHFYMAPPSTETNGTTQRNELFLTILFYFTVCNISAFYNVSNSDHILLKENN